MIDSDTLPMTSAMEPIPPTMTIIARIFPPMEVGDMSPYPTVVTVTINHQLESKRERKGLPEPSRYGIKIIVAI
ncbi:MAG: hypothetical protein V3S46_06525 [Nitrospinota bacterium]